MNSLRQSSRHSAHAVRLAHLLRWMFMAGLVTAALPAQAGPQYVNRNNTEIYLPFLVGDEFSFNNPGEDRMWRDEYARRFLLLSYGEARVNRPLFVDIGFEGLTSIDMPGVPAQIGNPSQVIEVQYTDPKDVALRAEAYAGGNVAPGWDLHFDLATRAHLVNDDIPAEFYGRLIASHKGFVGLNPLNAGFFLGPEIRALDVGIGGFTVGGFGLLSQRRDTFTQASVRATWWGNADPFQNLIRFQVSQVGTFMKRRLTARLSAGVDARQVRKDRYASDFRVETAHSRFVDLTLEGGLLAQLPIGLKFDISGRLVPYHTPDGHLVRWYRPVSPELSFVLERKIAVFDLIAGYTFSWVPPLYDPTEPYVDSGIGLVPDSAAGHLFSITLNIKI